MKISKKEKEQREYARSIITKKVNSLCVKYGYTYNRIAIKNTKTRLGSCSSKKNLNFNWQIIKFPEPVMNYVIIHEVAHLKYQNHKKEFWNEVERMDSDYKKHHKWIKQNSNKYIKF